MKSVLGIICEYNPFHIGHSYHIAASELVMNEHAPVVCVMSGDFVQRGESAIFPKHYRAEQAVKSGADLVVELPLPWCLASAEGFARGGVSILSALGVTHISFGSECGDIELLKSTAAAMAGDFQSGLRELIRSRPELSYASAVTELCGSPLLLEPNNLLGIEYIRAINDINGEIIPITVKRFNRHDGEDSAKDIRARIYAGELPGNPVNRDILETAIISRLRMFDKDYFSTLPNSADGLGNRLYDAIRTECTLEGIYAAAKTKRFPMSAIRRLAMCAALGINDEMSSGLPPYIRVLSFNEKGRQYLSSVKDSCRVPIITLPKEIYSLSENAQRVFASGVCAKDLYELGMDQENKMCGNDYRLGPVIV